MRGGRRAVNARHRRMDARDIPADAARVFLATREKGKTRLHLARRALQKVHPQ
jgi:hypothetical protein